MVKTQLMGIALMHWISEQLILENIICIAFTIRQPLYVHSVLPQLRGFLVLQHGNNFFVSAATSAAECFSAGNKQFCIKECAANSLQVFWKTSNLKTMENKQWHKHVPRNSLAGPSAPAGSPTQWNTYTLVPKSQLGHHKVAWTINRRVCGIEPCPSRIRIIMYKCV